MESDYKLILAPPSYSFSFFNLITLALFYAKIEVDLYIKWLYVFFPTLIFIAYKFLTCLKHVSQI